MDLEITNTFGQIGLNIDRAYLKLSQGVASLDISQETTHVGVETQLGNLTIDHKASLEDIGIYSALAIGPHYYEQYFNHGLESIGEMAADGDFMAMIERGHTVIDSIENKTAPSFQEVNIMYRRGAEIEYEPGGVRFGLQQGGVRLLSQPFPIEKTYQPGGVTAYMIQKGEVDIIYRGRKMDIGV